MKTPFVPIVLMVLALATGPLCAAEGLAIAIGLNSLDPNHYGGNSGQLRACENDAHEMLKIARAQNFSTVELLTSHATKAAVRQALQDAAQRLQPGDILVLSYSGHGGQTRDLNQDEDDGLDETWCLYDGQMVDDELAQIWAQFKEGVRIVVYSDSCHSGTVIKTYDPAARAALEKEGVRVLPEEVQKVVRALPENQNLGKDLPSEENSKALTKATVLLISGCQDNQLSRDGNVNGRFTEKLINAWAQGAFAGNYHDFYQKIHSLLPSDQKPNYDVYGAANPPFENQKPWTK